jgi:biotin operon repressor
MLNEIQKELRRGMFTASEIHKLMGKTLDTDTAQTYIMEKVAEELGVYEDEIWSKAIQWGNDFEPEAKRYYSLAMKVNIENSDFILAPWCEHAGASPDGKIEGQSKGLEFKCPFNPKNHIKHLMIRSAGELKSECKEYYWQIQMGLAVTGWDAWDFISFDPRFKQSLRMVAIEIKPEPADIALMKDRILKAVEIKNQILKRVMS